MFVASETVTIRLPVLVAGGFIVGIAFLVGFIARDEYGVARTDGIGPVRASLRALRKTIDALVMGD